VRARTAVEDSSSNLVQVRWGYSFIDSPRDNAGDAGDNRARATSEVIRDLGDMGHDSLVTQMILTAIIAP
jgi:hypothetical protein